MQKLLSTIVATVLVACSRGIDGAYATLPKVGAVIPSFDFAAFDSARLTSAALVGKPTVIALWSSDCSASREALSAIEAVSAEYAAHGVHVLLLADDAQPSATILELVRAAPALRVALAAGALDKTFSQTSIGPWHRPLALPSFLLVDQSGSVVHRQVGIEQDSAVRLVNLRTHIDRLLTQR